MRQFHSNLRCLFQDYVRRRMSVIFLSTLLLLIMPVNIFLQQLRCKSGNVIKSFLGPHDLFCPSNSTQPPDYRLWYVYLHFCFLFPFLW